MGAEFILVTGANGAGKSMLIESNKLLLEREGFRIIIPDNILRYATSLTDSTALIQEHIDDAISGGGNFVLESPFQFESLIKTIARIKKAGYGMSLYQLFVKDVKQSAIRVKDRFQEGGIFIPTDQVVSNFNANLNNVANQYHLFDHSYFIDNSTNQDMKLAAEFKKAVLVKFYSTQNHYLRKLFDQSTLQRKMGKEVFKIIKANRDYPTATSRRRKAGPRLKF
jgi:predicted ABC-type ATPase